VKWCQLLTWLSELSKTLCKYIKVISNADGVSFLHSVRSVLKKTKRVIYVPLNGEILHLIATPASLATSQRVLSDRAVQSSRDRRLSCGGTTVRLYARPDAASLVVLFIGLCLIQFSHLFHCCDIFKMPPNKKKICLIQGQSKLSFKPKSIDGGISGMYNLAYRYRICPTSVTVDLYEYYFTLFFVRKHHVH